VNLYAWPLSIGAEEELSAVTNVSCSRRRALGWVNFRALPFVCVQVHPSAHGQVSFVSNGSRRAPSRSVIKKGEKQLTGSTNADRNFRSVTYHGGEFDRDTNFWRTRQRRI
jgi:hypothetical protein